MLNLTTTFILPDNASKVRINGDSQPRL